MHFKKSHYPGFLERLRHSAHFCTIFLTISSKRGMVVEIVFLLCLFEMRLLWFLPTYLFMAFGTWLFATCGRQKRSSCETKISSLWPPERPRSRFESIGYFGSSDIYGTYFRGLVIMYDFAALQTPKVESSFLGSNVLWALSIARGPLLLIIQLVKSEGAWSQ
jgi:hypothetical protein